MASRSEKLRRRQKRKEKKRKRGSELEVYPSLPNPFVVVNPRGAVKMSEVLWELVKPDFDPSASKDCLRNLLSLGVAAWNASLMKGAERTNLLDTLAETIPAELRQDFYRLIEPLIRRKESLFSHIVRPIISYDLTWLPSGDPHLTVVSGLA